MTQAICEVIDHSGVAKRRAACKVLWSFESALDRRLVDDHLGGSVRQFTSLPRLYLLSHRLKVPLHPVDANRDAVDERERL